MDWAAQVFLKLAFRLVHCLLFSVLVVFKDVCESSGSFHWIVCVPNQRVVVVVVGGRMMWAAGAVAAMSSITFPAISAIVSRNADPDQQGRTMLQALCPQSALKQQKTNYGLCTYNRIIYWYILDFCTWTYIVYTSIILFVSPFFTIFKL